MFILYYSITINHRARTVNNRSSEQAKMDPTHEHATIIEKQEGSVRIISDVHQSGKPLADQYPVGLRLFLLAGASIMGVFLISLDQVSNTTQLPPRSIPKPPNYIP